MVIFCKPLGHDVDVRAFWWTIRVKCLRENDKKDKLQKVFSGQLRDRKQRKNIHIAKSGTVIGDIKCAICEVDMDMCIHKRWYRLTCDTGTGIFYIVGQPYHCPGRTKVNIWLIDHQVDKPIYTTDHRNGQFI